MNFSFSCSMGVQNIHHEWISSKLLSSEQCLPKELLEAACLEDFHWIGKGKLMKKNQHAQSFFESFIARTLIDKDG